MSQPVQVLFKPDYPETLDSPPQWFLTIKEDSVLIQRVFMNIQKIQLFYQIEDGQLQWKDVGDEGNLDIDKFQSLIKSQCSANVMVKWLQVPGRVPIQLCDVYNRIGKYLPERKSLLQRRKFTERVQKLEKESLDIRQKFRNGMFYLERSLLVWGPISKDRLSKVRQEWLEQRQKFKKRMLKLEQQWLEQRRQRWWNQDKEWQESLRKMRKQRDQQNQQWTERWQKMEQDWYELTREKKKGEQEKNQLEKTKRQKFKEQKLKNVKDIECIFCAIHLNPQGQEKIYQLHCGHCYHKSCIMKYCKTVKNQCPICRYSPDKKK